MDTELMLDVGQASEIKMAARRAGATNADLKKLSEGDMFAKILPVIRGQAQVVMAVVITIFKSLLDACHQTGFCNSDFTESRWLLEPVAADEADYEVVEHYLTKTGTLEEGLKQLEKLAADGKIRMLTGSRRAMEYIAQHQDAQLNHPIILPLRARRSSGNWCLPVFSRGWHDRRRGLDLYGTGFTFNSDYGWLVLRPKSSDGASKRQK